jgi:hypothetical protein
VLLVLGTSCIIVENCRAYKENMRKCLLSTTLFATTSIKQRPHLHFTYRSIKSINMSTQEAVVHVSENVAECKSDVPIPKLSADNWVLVKTKAVIGRISPRQLRRDRSQVVTMLVSLKRSARALPITRSVTGFAGLSEEVCTLWSGHPALGRC